MLNPAIILVIDDDNRIRQLLSKYLQENNFLVLEAQDTTIAKDIIENIVIDLIILDVMMPNENGNQFASNLRKKNNIPIIMLTAMSEVKDRIAGLESGVDDYLTKPFEPRELLLRINRILARAQIKNNISPIVNIGAIRFELATSRLMIGNSIIIITPTEAKLLSILALNLNKPMSRENLAKLCGGVNERSVDVQIIRLRNKIESDPKKPIYLHTVRGEGYILYG